MRNWLVVVASAWALALLPGAAEASEAGVHSGQRSDRAPDASRGTLLAAAPTVKLAQARQARPQARRAPPPKAKPAPPPPKVAAEEEAGDGQSLRRGEKVEFDARLIQGQTAKAGAVYLFERVSSDLSSMVQERRSYRREIVEEIFPQEIDR